MGICGLIPATLTSIDSRDIPMSAAIFDTLALVKTLQTKGFQAEQAEGISDALKDALAVAEIATKHDIEESGEATQRNIVGLREGITASQEATQRNIAASQEATQRDIKELLVAIAASREAAQRDTEELRLEFKAEIAPLKWAIGVCAAGIIPLVFKAFF
jgi:hypothetical protein